MSQTPAILYGHAPGHALPHASSVALILITVAAAALISSLVTAEVLRRAPAVAGPQSAAIAPAARAAPAASRDTSVPDAGVVFAGKEAAVEEPAPTF